MWPTKRGRSLGWPTPQLFSSAFSTSSNPCSAAMSSASSAAAPTATLADTGGRDAALRSVSEEAEQEATGLVPIAGVAGLPAGGPPPAAANGDARSEILAGIQRLKDEQKALKAERKRVAQALRNETRKKQRLQKKASTLSDTDLMQVLALRADTRAEMTARTDARRQRGAAEDARLEANRDGSD